MFDYLKQQLSPRAGSRPKPEASLYPDVAPTGHRDIEVNEQSDGDKYLAIGQAPGSPVSHPNLYPGLDNEEDYKVVALPRGMENAGSAYPVVVAWKPGDEQGSAQASEAAVVPATPGKEPVLVAEAVADVAAKKAAELTAAKAAEEVNEGEAKQEPVNANEQLVVSVPGSCEVHLIHEDYSTLIGQGEFRIVRISQGSTGLMLLARVGKDLLWPILGTEPVIKISQNHYIFTVLVPTDTEAEEEDGGKKKSWFSWKRRKSGSLRQSGKNDDKKADLLSYGVTFGPDVDTSPLDTSLQTYAQFSYEPNMSQAPPLQPEVPASADGEIVAEAPRDALAASAGAAAGASAAVAAGARNAEFWNSVSPNVDAYNSKTAKQIASSTGYVIRTIVGTGDTVSSTIEKTGKYWKGKKGPVEGGANIPPFILNHLKRVHKFSKMTDDVATATLNGIIRVTGFFTGAAIRSTAGQAIVHMLPGEVVLVSLDAFGKLLDALELSSKQVMDTSSIVTSDVVAHKFGEKAGEATLDTLKTGGHVLHTAWTVSKVRNVLNPSAAATSTTGVAGVASKVVRAAHTVEATRKQVDALKVKTQAQAVAEAQQQTVEQAAGTSVAGQLAKTAVKHAVFGKKGGPSFVEEVGKVALTHAIDTLKKPSATPTAAAAAPVVAN